MRTVTGAKAAAPTMPWYRVPPQNGACRYPAVPHRSPRGYWTPWQKESWLWQSCPKGTLPAAGILLYCAAWKMGASWWQTRRATGEAGSSGIWKSSWTKPAGVPGREARSGLLAEPVREGMENVQERMENTAGRKTDALAEARIHKPMPRGYGQSAGIFNAGCGKEKSNAWRIRMTGISMSSRRTSWIRGLSSAGCSRRGTWLRRASLQGEPGYRYSFSCLQGWQCGSSCCALRRCPWRCLPWSAFREKAWHHS